MTSEKVEFVSPQGETLSGVLERPSGDTRGWAVFAHCFTCSKTGLAASRIARGLAAQGIGTLRFDFTGLGDSGGDFAGTGFSTNVDDLVAAANWMNGEGRPVSLMVGHSLGGAATVVAATRLPGVKAVVTIGAPSDADHVVDQFAKHVPEIEAKGEAVVDLAGRPFTLRKSFIDDVKGARVRDAAAALKRPLMVMHSPVDDVVGIDNATGLFLAAKHPKSFVSLDNAGHLLTRAEEADFAVEVIAGWSRRYIDTNDAAKSTVPQTHEVIVRETRANGAYQNEVLIEGERFLADEPASVGGAGTGPDPYAWVTAGLGACTSMTIRMYAARKGWNVDRVSVSLNHDKRHLEDCVDCGPKDRIDVFTRDILIEGDLDETQRERLLEIADRCPVHRTLEGEAVIQTRAATNLA